MSSEAIQVVQDNNVRRRRKPAMSVPRAQQSFDRLSREPTMLTQALNSNVADIIRTLQVDGRPSDDKPRAFGPALRSQHELAWDLAQLLGHLLNQIERTTMYMTLGAGETYQTIAMLLRFALNKHILLTHELIEDIERWLRGYVGTDEEVEICVLIDGLRSVKSRHGSRGRTHEQPMTSEGIVKRRIVTQK